MMHVARILIVAVLTAGACYLLLRGGWWLPYLMGVLFVFGALAASKDEEEEEAAP